MKKWSFRSLLLAIALACNLNIARANESEGEVVMPADCNACCCQSGSLVFDLEGTFFRYHRADGVQDAANQIEFGFELSPRITLGYQTGDGLGVRLRYWDYDHNARSGNDVITVDTFTLDAEWFRKLQLACDTTLEFSSGIRYLDFSETLLFNTAATNEDTSFSAPGLLAGLQVNQRVLGGEIYARARGSLLMSDKRRSAGAASVLDFDTTHAITELSTGYQVSYCLASGAILDLRAGVEMQNWTNLSVSNNTSLLSVDDIPTDVGFGGFVIGAGLTY